jgi:hypothetical protein
MEITIPPRKSATTIAINERKNGYQRGGSDNRGSKMIRYGNLFLFRLDGVSVDSDILFGSSYFVIASDLVLRGMQSTLSFYLI